MAVCVVMLMQSLADIARREAARRKLLDEQGIEGKVIEGNPVASSSRGNLTLSTPAPAAPQETSKRGASSKSQPALRPFRNALQKLDRTIRQEEKRLETRRTRLQAERWAPPKAGKVTSRNQSEDIQNRLREEIEELQLKLKELRRERAEIYDEGKKAGFLPGELEGKGLIP
jgi:predicted RNase H-like nuclease (RuvC/YqgF family)